MEEPAAIHDSFPPMALPQFRKTFQAHTHIGLRGAQEDRITVCPQFLREDAAFFGVFDGTVGDDASHFISRNIVHHICSCEEVKTGSIFEEGPEGSTPDSYAERIGAVLRQSFLSCDKALIDHCAERNLHYASSTGVSAFLWQNLLTVAHIGDSKACIAKIIDGKVQPEWLTVDHKPNMAAELQRIQASGGSLAWLHGNKPYIRGGDFHPRQANGEHPKQLNYSRAFGGKDLKMFGLIADPDVSHFEIMPEDKLVLIASDGLWDVLNPKLVCELAIEARQRGVDATEYLVKAAINEMPNVGVRDNISVIAIFLNEQMIPPLP